MSHPTFSPNRLNLSSGVLAEMKKKEQEKKQAQAVESQRVATRDSILSNQLRGADQFSQNLPQYIDQETAQMRGQLASQLAGAQRQARGSANARGMLYSGQRMKQEGDLANQASQQLSQARAEAIRRALGQEQALYAQPVMSRANIAETSMQQQGLLDKYKQDTMRNRQNIVNTGADFIGEGVGKWLGG